jgi:hypothetical protein
LVAAGFPVIIERDMGDVRPNADWTGHYGVITGYDDGLGSTYPGFLSLISPWPMKTYRYWRAFNHVYVVIYPPEREAEVLAILGPHADEAYNLQHAAEKAQGAIPP